jgi:hypothetical protein
MRLYSPINKKILKKKKKKKKKKNYCNLRNFLLIFGNFQQWKRKISSRHHVGDCASSHKIDYVTKFKEILNLEGHQNRITGSRVTAILLNGWILPVGEVASGRVCACSLRSRLVLEHVPFKMIIKQVPITNKGY